MKILICGSRYGVDRKYMDPIFDTITQSSIGPHLIIHGAATGVDTMAGIIAKERRWPVRAVPKLPGERGYDRNVRMLHLTEPELVIGFPHLKYFSRGTHHMMTIAIQKRIQVLTVTGWDVHNSG